MVSRRALARLLAFEARAYLRTGLLRASRRAVVTPRGSRSALDAQPVPQSVAGGAHLQPGGAGRAERLDIVLVPGLAATPSQFWDVKRALEGVTEHFDAFEYASFQHPRRIARDLADYLEARAARSQRRMLVVGHSLGGLLLSIVLQSPRPPPRIVGFASICAPLHGTRLSRLAPGSSLRALAPEGELVSELVATRARLTALRGCVLSVAARFDSFITPYSSALLEGYPQLLLEDVGHVGSLFDPRVFSALVDFTRKIERTWSVMA